MNAPSMVVQKSGYKTKIKEADSIKLPPLPDVPQFEAWKNSLRSQVMAASGRRDEAFRWIVRSEEHTSELRHSSVSRMPSSA